MSNVPTVEPFWVTDTFVTGAGPLQFMGDNLRLTLFVAQRFTYDGENDGTENGGTENAVVAKLVGSRADMLQIAAAIVRGCNSAETPADKATEAFEAFLDAPRGRH